MFRISLCDDDPISNNSVFELINKIKPFEGNYIIDTFLSGTNLLQNIHKNYHIIFLDIDLKENMNGIDIGIKIREYDKNLIIVFFTSFVDPPVEAFHSLPFRYILKPLSEKSIEEFNEVFQEALNQIQFIIIKTSGRTYKVSIESILYISIDQRKIIIVTDTEKYITSDKIIEMYEKLSSFGFAFPHKSFLVNMNRIYTIEKGIVKLDNGDIIPISQPKATEFRKSFTQYAYSKGWE